MTYTKCGTKNPADPYFPVSAQVIMPGDSVLRRRKLHEHHETDSALFEFQKHQSAVRIDALFPARQSANYEKYSVVHGKGLAEPLSMPASWITHRTAFYDDIFF